MVGRVWWGGCGGEGVVGRGVWWGGGVAGNVASLFGIIALSKHYVA